MHDSPPPPERLLFVSLGAAQTAKSDVRVRQPGNGTDLWLQGVRWANLAGQPTIYYQVAQAQFASSQARLGFLVDLTHNKAIANPRQVVATSGTWQGKPTLSPVPLQTYVQKLRYTNGLNSLSVCGIYRGASGGALFQPYLATGPAYYILWCRNRVDGAESTAVYRGAGFGWLSRMGFTYRLGANLGVQGALTYTHGTGHAPVEGGRVDTALNSWHRTFGIVARL